MDFLYKKHPKGTYEYANYKKIMDIIITLILFALALGLYIIGRVTTGSNRNLLTIVAVLGLLPACKMVVDVIMCLRVKPCDIELKARIDSKINDLYGLYNMYFTSYDKNFYIDHMIVTAKSIIGYSSMKSFDEKAYYAHMNDLLRKEGIKDIVIKIFDDDKKYLNRLGDINALEEGKEPNIMVAALIKNITL